MRRRIWPVSCLILLAVLASSAYGTSYLQVFAHPGGETSASIEPGATLELVVMLFNDEPVLAVEYAVQLPVNYWRLDARSYGEYGWYADGGSFDNATPGEVWEDPTKEPKVPVNYPYVVDEMLYDITPGTPDFWMSTGRADDQALAAGSHIVERFLLFIPGSTPVGSYNIALANQYLMSPSFDEVPSTVGPDFTLNVVPEPGTLALGLLGLVALGLLRARRRQGADSPAA